MNIIVTGGEGFIGKNLVRKLSNLEHSVLILDKKSGADVTKHLNGHIWFYENIWGTKNIDALIHLAAIHDVQYAETHEQETFDTNVYGTYNMIQSAIRNKIPKFIFISSAAVENKQGVYGLTKHLGEEIVKNSGLDYSILRLFNVYGKDGKGLIGNLVKARDTETTFKLYGDGKQTRDFIHVDDICEAIIKSIDTKSFTYDVGTGKSYSVNQVIDIFQQYASQHHGPIEIERLLGLKEIRDSKANPVFYKTKITLEDGLRGI